MPDESKILAGAKVVKELVEAVPVYQDTLQPAAKEFGESTKPTGRELGQALTTVARTVNSALVPLRGLLWCWDQVA